MLRKVLAVFCLLTLSACGLKGSLYLPDQKPVSEPAPAATTTSTPSTATAQVH